MKIEKNQITFGKKVCNGEEAIEYVNSKLQEQLDKYNKENPGLEVQFDWNNLWSNITSYSNKFMRAYNNCQIDNYYNAHFMEHWYKQYVDMLGIMFYNELYDKLIVSEFWLNQRAALDKIEAHINKYRTAFKQNV